MHNILRFIFKKPEYLPARDTIIINFLLAVSASILLAFCVIVAFAVISEGTPMTEILSSCIFVFIIHIAVIPSFHKKQVTGREGMLGAQGRVVETLTPVGTIIVKGEYWRAKSLDDNIEVDKDVEIVGLEGLMLRVKRKSW